MTAQDDSPPGYELLERVAEGGMGVVYAARRAGKRVALKLLRPELALDRTVAARFVREAWAAKACRHPNLVALEDAGVMPSGRPFVAYEWVAGQTLESHGPTTTATARQLGLQLLEALGAAHGAGWLHRDVTPRNALVDGAALKLIDFGLVTTLERSVDAAAWTRLTRTGFVVGTPPYMAPEQIEAGPVDARTDLWAVGVILYWLSSGQEPFGARTPTLRMLKAVSERAPALVSVTPHASPSFAKVVDRALSRQPSARWESAAAMADALRGAETSDAPPPVAPDLATTQTLRRPLGD